MKTEENQDIAWYVSIYSNGLVRTYNFKSEEDRDWMYEFLLDRSLRTQKVEINDCKTKEKILLNLNSTITKGETPCDLQIEGELIFEANFHKKEEIVLSVFSARF